MNLDRTDLSQAEIESITQFLDVNAEPDHADIAFDFGGQFIESAYSVSNLFNRGVVDYVLLSGGINRITGANEARTHLEVVLQQGVPHERIIIEDEATNTYDQALLTLSEVSAYLDIAEVKSVVVVTKWYHCRRAIMTLKASWPEGIRYFTHCFEPVGRPRAEWWLNDTSLKRALGECKRIHYYLGLGHLAEIHKVDGAWV